MSICRFSKAETSIDLRLHPRSGAITEIHHPSGPPTDDQPPGTCRAQLGRFHQAVGSSGSCNSRDSARSAPDGKAWGKGGSKARVRTVPTQREELFDSGATWLAVGDWGKDSQSLVCFNLLCSPACHHVNGVAVLAVYSTIVYSSVQNSSIHILQGHNGRPIRP